VWSTTIADRGIELENAVRYPEVVVEALSTVNPASRWTTTPALIVEVLSPSSVERDLEDKPAEYATIPSLHAYIAASQTEPAAWFWLRSPRGRFPAKAKKMMGPVGSIVIPSLGLSLALADIYRDLLGRSP
jgi:Uma2 family endonuclease